MAKFITVLDTHVGLSFWQAVQWDDDLESLRSNPFYTAGVNLSLPKGPGNKQVGHKVITERSTHLQGGATMIQLSTLGQELLALAKNSASEKVIVKLVGDVNQPNPNL